MAERVTQLPKRARVSHDDDCETGSAFTNSFHRWLVDFGASWDAVEFRRSASHGLGAYAKHALRPGELIAKIPRKLVFSLRHLQDDPAVVEGRKVTEDERTLLYLAMIRQRSDPKSFFHPFLQSLPTSFDDTAWWSEEELGLLAGTPLAQAASKARDDLAALHERVCVPLSRSAPEIFPLETFSLRALRWAKSAFDSRAFPESLIFDAVKSADESGSMTTADFLRSHAGRVSNSACLLPMLDVLNHQCPTAVTWVVSPLEIGFRCGEEIPAGNQVFNNYGPKYNESLLHQYGFVDDHWRAACVRVTVGIAETSASLARFKHSLMEQVGVNKSEFVVQVDASGGPVWEEGLWERVRVSVLSASECGDLPSRLSNSDFRSHFSSIVSRRNEQEALATVTSILHRHLDALDVGEETAGSSTTLDRSPVRARMAEVYRQGRRLVLTSALKSLELDTDRETLAIIPRRQCLSANDIMSMETLGKQCLQCASGLDDETLLVLFVYYVLLGNAAEVTAREPQELARMIVDLSRSNSCHPLSTVSKKDLKDLTPFSMVKKIWKESARTLAEEFERIVIPLADASPHTLKKDKNVFALARCITARLAADVGRVAPEGTSLLLVPMERSLGNEPSARFVLQDTGDVVALGKRCAVGIPLRLSMRGSVWDALDAFGACSDPIPSHSLALDAAVSGFSPALVDQLRDLKLAPPYQITAEIPCPERLRGALLFSALSPDFQRECCAQATAERGNRAGYSIPASIPSNVIEESVKRAHEKLTGIADRIDELVSTQRGRLPGGDSALMNAARAALTCEEKIADQLRQVSLTLDDFGCA